MGAGYIGNKDSFIKRSEYRKKGVQYRKAMGFKGIHHVDNPPVCSQPTCIKYVSNQKVIDYSLNKYGRVICYTCQSALFNLGKHINERAERLKKEKENG